jgi:tetratricopeptide (TPR) repeat protein
VAAVRRKLPEDSLKSRRFVAVGIVVLALVVAFFVFKLTTRSVPDATRYNPETMPSTPDGMIRAGLSALKAQQIRTAQSYFVGALQLDPDNPVALYNLGVIATNLGNDAAATALYLRAIRSDPTMNVARYNLAVSQTRLGRFAAAMATYAELIGRDPDNLNAQWNLGLLLYKAGHRREGRVLLRKVIAADSKFRSRLPQSVALA